MRIHGPTDVEKQKDLHRVATLRSGFYVDIAMFRGRLDRTGEIEFLFRAIAGPTPQPL